MSLNFPSFFDTNRLPNEIWIGIGITLLEIESMLLRHNSVNMTIRKFVPSLLELKKTCKHLSILLSCENIINMLGLRKILEIKNSTSKTVMEIIKWICIKNLPEVENKLYKQIESMLHVPNFNSEIFEEDRKSPWIIVPIYYGVEIQGFAYNSDILDKDIAESIVTDETEQMLIFSHEQNNFTPQTDHVIHKIFYESLKYPYYSGYGLNNYRLNFMITFKKVSTIIAKDSLYIKLLGNTLSRKRFETWKKLK